MAPRRLARFVSIEALNPIEGADRIEVATVEGWKVVVQKGLYEVMDQAVYCEIDSVLPLEYFPDLEKVKGRIKTIRLRGQISQGFLIPASKVIDILESQGYVHKSYDCGGDIWAKADKPVVYWMDEEQDVAPMLGILKYEPPVTFKDGETKGSFPTHLLPKTDEERVQSNLDFIEMFRGKPWVATVKYDGSSGTFGREDGEFFACSRNLMKKDGDNVFWNMARKYNIEEGLKGAYESYIVQGEVVGPGVQKNYLGLKEIEFHVFRVYNTIAKRYLTYDERTRFCADIGLPHVALDSRGDAFDFDLDTLMSRAEAKYPGTTNEREGLVYEVDHFVDTEFGGHCSFKTISNAFLIGGGD